MERYPIYIPAETYVIADALNAFNKISHLSWPLKVRLVLSFFEYQQDFKTISRRGLYPVYQECVCLPEMNQRFGYILLEMWKFLAEDAGVEFIIPGDKTPYNMASINSIGRSFPNGLYLFITRHPYDVCASYLKMGRYNDLASAARRWHMAHVNWLRLIKRFPSLKTKLIRYEELVQKPEQIIFETGKWLGLTERKSELKNDVFWGDIDLYQHISGAKSGVNTASIGKGARALGETEKDIVKDIVGDMSKSFGYEL